MESPRFTLFLQLPVSIQWTVLNNLSFKDLIIFCSVNKYFRSYQSNPEYMQQRLFSLGVDIRNFQHISSLLEAKDGYVSTLIYFRQIRKDPTIVDFVFKSNVLFPGVEYIIGFITMGLRSIEMNQGQHLMYVLRSCPNDREIRKILPVLMLNHMLGDQVLSPEDLDLLSKVPRDRTRILTRDRFFLRPDFLDRSEDYLKGLQNIIIKGGQPSLAYTCGLIDGEHEQNFIDLYREHEKLQFKEFSDMSLHDSYRRYMIIYEEIIDYVVKFGTSKMLEAIIPDQNGSHGQPILVSHAIDEDNLSTAKYILDPFDEEIKDIVPHYLAYGPKSVEMLNLLRSNGVHLSEYLIMLGAFESGNYDLLEPYVSMMKDEDMWDVISKAPGHMIETYFTELKDAYLKDSKDISDLSPLDELVRYLAQISDLYRIDLLLELGYVPCEEVVTEIKDGVPKNEMSLIFSLFIEAKYPHLHRLLS